MILPFPAIDAAFKASSPRDSVAILFLIEDSSTMSSLWPRMRDFYLPKVLETIKDANPSIPIHVLWMPTSQLSPTNFERPSSSRRSRRWNEIPVLNFSQHSSNKVSSVAVSRAVDALVLAFGQTQAIRHIVVIAASNPTGESPSRPNTLSWLPLVHKLHQEDTRLHMIVRSQYNMDGLTSLFWETIKNDFSRPCVTDDTHYTFYLRNEAESPSQSASDSALSSDTKGSASPTAPSSSRTSSSSSIHKPSLVFQLQKMNGMEKKRRSRARRDPLNTSRPNKPYQKSPANTGGHQQTASPPESPAQPGARVDASAHTLDDAGAHVYDTHSRGTPEDNTPYSATTSPTRSLSPASPRYLNTHVLASSPAFHHMNPLPCMPTTAYDITKWPVTSPTPDSVPSESGYQDPPIYRSDSGIGPIRSHYPATHHHESSRSPRSQTLVQAVGGDSYVQPWRQPQRQPNETDFYQHSQYHSALDATHAQLAGVPVDSSYLSNGNYGQVSTDLSAFYSEYDTGANCYPDYEGANTEPPDYTFSMHSSSLHPPPVSFTR